MRGAGKEGKNKEKESKETMAFGLRELRLFQLQGKESKYIKEKMGNRKETSEKERRARKREAHDRVEAI